MLAPIRNDLMEETQWAQQTYRPPPECPPSKHYIPTTLRPQVLQLVHAAPSSGHPSIHQTMTLIQNKSRDVEDYVRACAICAQSKRSHQLPMGLL